MASFIVKRLLLLIPVLFGVSILVFALTRMGDPTAAYQTPGMTNEEYLLLREEFHLNDNLLVQYYYWLSALLQGDWGYSKTAGLEVTDAIALYFPATLELALVSIIIAVFIGIALGTLSAVKKDKPIDHATRVLALAGVCFPIFWLGLIFLYIFYLQLGWFPIGHRYDIILFDPTTINQFTGLLLVDTLLNGDVPFFMDALWHIFLPAITLAFGTIAIVTRIMRSSMLEVLNQDYIRTARSKGVPEKVVIRKHARRNAMIPTTTVVGLAFGALLGGAVLTETIYSWPGMGLWSTQAIASLETSSILAFTIVTAVIFVICNLMVDILYAYLDPRVSLE